MITNTKALFSSVLKDRRADCICDIGSRDGDQALLFRHLRPEAVVLAFEANPINFRAMQAKEHLRANRIELFPFAISNQRGWAAFHISDVDYSDPSENIGTSSLLVHQGVKIKESAEIETRRIDDFILEHCPAVQRIGLWIDVEGAEYLVIEGMAKIKDRVVALHVETAKTPMRLGQRTLSELLPFMETQGFVACGSNILPDSIWGDVVFVNKAVARTMGWRLTLCKGKAYASYLLRADRLAVALRGRFPWLYRVLRQAYIRFGT